MRLPGKLLPVLALVALVGCHGYDIVQTNVFVDDDANVISVDYGRADRDHVTTFQSPVNGKEMDFKSKLVVRVTLPDGRRITAWQCMNFLRTGTMYETDDKEWKVLANGFSTLVYRLEPPDRYREVFRGVLCDSRSPNGDKPVKDDRWRVISKPDQNLQKQKNEPSR